MSLQPSHLLVLKSKEESASDLLFYVSRDERHLIEHKPCSLSVENISVIGYYDDYIGIMSDIYDGHTSSLLNIVQYALKHDTKHSLGFPQLITICCAAAGVRGSVSTLVLCNDLQIRQLIVDSEGRYNLEPFDVSVLYQCGRMLSQDEMLKQIDAQHVKNVTAVSELFDPNSQSGFIMPTID